MAGVSVDLEELSDFVIFAKKETYTGDRKKIVLPDGSKMFEPVVRGHLRYEDTFKGRLRIGGRVKVLYDDIFFWHMFYHGGIKKKFWQDEGLVRRAFAALRKAWLHSDAGPFRGPPTCEDGDIKYFNNAMENNLSDLSDYHGQEELWVKQDQIYVLQFGGGLIE